MHLSIATKRAVFGGITVKTCMVTAAALDILFTKSPSTPVKLGLWLVIDMCVTGAFAFSERYGDVAVGMAGATIPVSAGLIGLAATESADMQPFLASAVAVEVISMFIVLTCAAKSPVDTEAVACVRPAPAEEEPAEGDVCLICHGTSAEVRDHRLYRAPCGVCTGSQAWRCSTCVYMSLGIQYRVPIQWASCPGCREFMVAESRLMHEECTGEASIRRDVDSGECWCETCGVEFESRFH